MSISSLSLIQVKNGHPFSTVNPGWSLLDQLGEKVDPLAHVYFFYQLYHRQPETLVGQDIKEIHLYNDEEAKRLGIHSEDNKFIVPMGDNLISVYWAPNEEDINISSKNIDWKKWIEDLAQEKNIRVQWSDGDISMDRLNGVYVVPETDESEIALRSKQMYVMGNLLTPDYVESQALGETQGETMHIVYSTAALAVLSSSISQGLAIATNTPVDMKELIYNKMTEGRRMPLDSIKTMNGMMDLYIKKFNKSNSPDLDGPVVKVMQHGLSLANRAVAQLHEELNEAQSMSM